MPDGMQIPGGPSFAGSPQPPDVPCDPTGDGWRGPPGPQGPPGGSYTLPVASTTVLGGVKSDGSTIAINASGVISSTVVGGVASFNTRTGAITLSSGDVTTVLPPSSTTPSMDGVAAAGSGTSWARADHVHPTDTSRYAATNPSGYQTQAQVRAGTTTNDNAAAGQIGEFVTAARTTNLALATTVGANLTSISLTAGDWDVDGNVNVLFSVGGTEAAGSVSLTSGAVAGAADGSGYGQINMATASLTYVSLATGSMRVSIAATTTVYLTASGTFTSGTANAQGVIRARRRR